MAIVLRDSAPPAAHLLPTIDHVTEAVPDAALIAIDIPIGLLADGVRRCDVEAAAFVGPRRSSVFITPVRAALEAPTHLAASTINRQRTGAGTSQQAFGLRHKILEVDRWLPASPCPVFEVHPEVAFTIMLGHPPTAGKKSWQGMSERHGAVVAAGIDLTAVDAPVGAVAAVDDVLDAAAVAWSARRLRAGTARSIPEPPDVGPDGRAIAIWA